MEKDADSFEPLPALAEYFVVAGIADSDAKDPTKLSPGTTVDPILLDWFPQSFQENRLRRDLPAFVFPEGLKIHKQKRECVYYTVGTILQLKVLQLLIWDVAFTDDTGRRLYGCCFLFDQNLSQPGSPDVYVWKCLCLLTKQSRFELMRECLKAIYLESSKSGSVESLIATLLNTPAPGYGLCLKLRLNTSVPPSSPSSTSQSLSTPSPSHIHVMPAPARGFPVADYRLLLIFERMGMAAVMDLLAAVLTERKVLFISESFSLLGVATESLCALMYPLIWPYVFIPILPAKLIECIEAPTPYIIGIHRNWAPVRGDARLAETFVADLDTGELIPPQVSADGGECHLPERHVSNLRARLIPLLRPAIAEMDLAFPPPNLSVAESSRVVSVRALFLEFLLGILTQLTSGVPRGAAPLDAKATLRNKPDLVSISFYEQMVDTQAFQQLFTAWTKEHVNVTRKLSALERYLRSPANVSFEYPSASAIAPSSSPRSTVSLLSRSTGALTLPLFASPLRKNLISPRSDQTALFAINDQLKKSPSAPLYLLQAGLLLRKENLNTTSLFEALHSIEAACAKDEESLEAALELLQTVLEKQDDDTLEQALKIGNYVSKLSSSILQWRSGTSSSSAKTQSASAPALLLEQTSLVALLPSTTFVSASSSSSPRAIAMKTIGDNVFLLNGDEMLATLQNIKLPSRDARMSKQTFAQFSSRIGLATDEAFGVRLFEALSRLGKKKTTIRYAKVVTYVNQLKEIYSSHAKWAGVLNLDQKEFVMYISDTRMLSGLNSQRGSLILTNQRVLFQARPSNSLLLNISLRDISRVEKEQYVVIVPPGVPSLRLWTANKIDPVWFLMFAERELLVPVLQSLSVAQKIASEISDSRHVNIETNIVAIVCAVYRITAGANVASSLLSFSDGYASQPFALMAKKLQKFGILNLDQITLSSSDNMSELSTNDPLSIARDALLTISDLMYAYVTHGGTIDLAGLLKCEALSKYIAIVNKLASVDLKRLSESERLCFFVNIHNALVIHAYTIAGVPCSYLEWRYLCARACYCIGGSAYSLDDIIHGVLRGNQPLVNFASTDRFELNDPRRFSAQKQPDLRALLVLCYHTRSSPSLYLLESKSLERSLQDAVRQFLSKEIFEYYRSDFGSDDDIIRWIAKHTADEDIAENVTRVLTSPDHVVKYWSDWKESPKPIVILKD